MYSEKDKEYYLKNRDLILKKSRNYYENNKSAILDRVKEYNKINKLKISERKRFKYINDKANGNLKKRKYVRRDASKRFRNNISRQIRSQLTDRGHSKRNNSILKYLPYSINDLKIHLESQFELWMSWGNYGTYNVCSWNDYDPLTWTWQIDHIIPQSNFNFSSMGDLDFQKCWALENLRPYSAKQNIIDGARKKIT